MNFKTVHSAVGEYMAFRELKLFSGFKESMLGYYVKKLHFLVDYVSV